MDLNKFHEQVFFSTLRITVPSDDGKGASVGTGFIFIAEVGTRRAVLLVSNKHVLNPGIGKTVILNFHQKDEKNKPSLAEKITIRDQRDKGNGQIYIEHPDSGIDLACLNITEIVNPKYKAYFQSLDSKFLDGVDYTELEPGQPVIFVGYPEGWFDAVNELPLMRTGTISSIPGIDFNGNPELIIDAHIHKGSSGSPVFTKIGSVYKLIGVLSRAMLKKQQRNGYVQEFIGLGFVIKLKCIEELIAEATKRVK